ncbi:DUF6714 family protein [Janthinobacterium sp. 64]|uniref:DUF6714 family protein n=1 Tax=Janthinobacterium sp. 64 TaxID=2035208 RepID=UPI000C2C5F5A|nr:DUF6714 family protein [Janthinobacterium sp. 64]PKB20599.1 hypothetical protein CLU91_0945 [Janthinobacterium sp. 64]
MSCSDKVSTAAADAASLIACIERAFAGTQRPETSLRQFLLTDKYGMSEDISEREWAASGRDRVDSIWQEIPDAEIEEGEGLLAHMEAEEFLYYLPAYMRYAVAYQHRASWETDVLGMTVHALSPSERNQDSRAYAIAKYAGFNAAQRQAVVQFLTFVVQVDESLPGQDALAALAGYWQADTA